MTLIEQYKNETQVLLPLNLAKAKLLLLCVRLKSNVLSIYLAVFALQTTISDNRLIFSSFEFPAIRKPINLQYINSIKLKYTQQNIIKGAIIYSIGDTVAALLLTEFAIYRLFGMMLIGATIYAFEIPNYFTWIDKKTISYKGIKKTLAKTGLAIAYFNPLWIFRHLVFIKLFSGNYQFINSNLFLIAFWSFLANIPISLIANYIIQNKIRLDWRFMASAIFSALMAIYYALSETIFQ